MLAHQQNEGRSKGGKWISCFWHGIACDETRDSLVVTYVDMIALFVLLLLLLLIMLVIVLSFFSCRIY